MDLSKILSVLPRQIISSEEILRSFNKEFNQMPILSSGSKNFDKVLEGGFKKGLPYLIFGPNRTGKTQLCHQLCVQAYKLFMEEGLKYNILYIDTENTFRPERLTELCEAKGIDSNEALKSINVSNIISNSAFLLVLEKIEKLVENIPNNLLIIDSINNHYRSEQGDPEKPYNKVKNDFIEILTRINLLTKNFNCFTITTAQVTPNFLDNAIIQDLPVGNLFINHFFSEFLYLSHKEDNKNFVHLINSLVMPEKRILYKITAEGIEDYRL